MYAVRYHVYQYYRDMTYQSKAMIHILSGKVSAFAVDIQEAILGGGIQHGLPHGGVVGIGDVNDRELDRG
jgi:hypothetical protein